MTTLTVFQGHTRIAQGSLAEVASALLALEGLDGVLVFDDATGRQTDLDLRGTAEDVVTRHATPPAGRGRPKLGVTAREVTLLPRHWDWLATQPGGASATLRRLIDAARETPPTPEQARRAAREACYRFLHALAGDFAGYEQALRCLFAGDDAGFAVQIAGWPADVQSYAQGLAAVKQL